MCPGVLLSMTTCVILFLSALLSIPAKATNYLTTAILKGLVRVHHNALVIREAHFPKKYEPLIDSYIADLKLVRGDITNETKLHDAYKMFIPPLIDLAKANNFESGWRYNSKTPLLERIEK